MRAIIIEDELLAQEKLEFMLRRVEPAAVVVARLGSVKESLAWLVAHEAPDVAFVDIQLSDDHSFEIFKQFEPTFPVVFTTAYDRYVLQSFEYNSIDYLLKPITEEKLKRTLDKLKKLGEHFTRRQLTELIPPNTKEHSGPGQLSHVSKNEVAVSMREGGKFADRIVARKGNHYIVVPIHQVAYFFSMHKIVFVRDVNGKQMIVDKNLAALEATLDPRQFIRLNRKYIAAAHSIVAYTTVLGKLQVTLFPEVDEHVFVSREAAPRFRMWISQRGN